MSSSRSNRPDGRSADALRPISFVPDFAPHAGGSVLTRFGQTQVICAAMLENRVPPWMHQQGISGGWITAEYSMLPYSTLERKNRDSSKGKVDGRSIEIQRLIGRAIRAIADLEALPGWTLWIDCDVLQADGGTRTASITGAYLAAQMAVRRALHAGSLRKNPLGDSVAAVSVGVWEGREILDLNYLEDKDASVDANIVMTGSGQFVEAQASGEEATFTRDQLDVMLALAEKGLHILNQQQEETLETWSRENGL
jgi:ribonuclease PH